MKLSSVVLLSVNLVAASQVAANAADTASFLQDALTPSAASAKSAPRPAARPVAKKRASKTSYVAMTPVMDGVKCRPFMPGRYLPSESELEARKEAERARREAMSFAPADVLTGRVAATNDLSNMSAMAAPAASYAMSRPANQDYMHKVQGIVQKVKEAAKGYSLAHTRSVPGMNPVMPGQFAQNSGASAAMPRIPEPQRATMPLNVPQPPVARSMPVQVPQAPQHVAASAPVVPLPSLSKWDNAQLDKLIDNNMPENVYANVNGDMRASQGNPGVSGAGPTPYPLNSINRRGVQTIGAQARFGSWHGGHENLPQSSFQSYMPVHMAGPMAVKINHYSGGSKKTGRQAARIAAKHHVASAPTAASVLKVDKVKSIPAASYPPYRRYGSMF